jgi:leucyl/phenylalanyl-tRNA--protein transferase
LPATPGPLRRGRTEWTVKLLTHSLIFPPHHTAAADGLLAIGGDLSVPRLLAAYRHGVFPWYNVGEPIMWWSPDPRLILEPDRLKIARSLRTVIRKGRYAITFDTAFRAVIRACASTPRGDDLGTWIHPEVERAYTSLHDLGYAHSVEAWEAGTLVGGLYGVLIGRCFFGESMFSHRENASKVALAALAGLLIARGVSMIDCQVTTLHLMSLGAREIPRGEFLRRLQAALGEPTGRESWTAPPVRPSP